LHNAGTADLPPRAWAGGLALAVLPMPRPARYRLRLRHPRAAQATDRIADHAFPVLMLSAGVLATVGFLPGLDPAFRLFWLGSAVGLLTGVPFVHERRQLRRRLRDLPPVHDPLDELQAALPEDPAVALLVAGDARAALALVGERDRDDPAALRIGAMAAATLGDTKAARARALRAVQVEPPVWEVPAQTGLLLCQSGRFGEGVRLLERAADVAEGHYRAELMLAHGMALAGRLRDAVDALDRAQGRPARAG
jgi:tetratricopeptide (TPR) repeat protein